MRTWPRFNGLMTPPARALLRFVGGDPDEGARHLPRIGEVRLRLPGGRDLRLWSPGNETVSNHLFWGGLSGYEPETTAVFVALARNAGTVLDVGAHVGFFSLLAALENPAARVVAFEPFPPVLDLLRRNLDRNEVRTVEIVEMAAGEIDGETEFWFAASDIIATVSSRSRRFMEQWHVPLQSTQVPVVRLDRFVEERGLAPVDLVKIDTEATEYEVLLGLEGVLVTDRPAVVCEILVGQPHLEEIEALLRRVGYRTYHLTPDGPRERDVIEPHWPEQGGYEKAFRNWLFTPRGPEEVADLWREAPVMERRPRRRVRRAASPRN